MASPYDQNAKQARIRHRRGRVVAQTFNYAGILHLDLRQHGGTQLREFGQSDFQAEAKEQCIGAEDRVFAPVTGVVQIPQLFDDCVAIAPGGKVVLLVVDRFDLIVQVLDCGRADPKQPVEARQRLPRIDHQRLPKAQHLARIAPNGRSQPSRSRSRASCRNAGGKSRG